jgi:hypothetical protein
VKKTIKKSDGSEITFEGTLEEIIELEKKIKQENQEESKKQPLQPGLLNEETQQFSNTYWYPVHSPFCEITSAMRGWFSIIPPRCTCGAVPQVDWTVYRAGWSVTTDSTGLWAIPKVTFKG